LIAELPYIDAIEKGLDDANYYKKLDKDADMKKWGEGQRG
jgi:hypothetical protein